MWIRSQDKTSLFMSYGICIYEFDGQFIISDIGGFGKCATYSTKEKALKVLKQIQNTISDRVVINGQLYVPPRRINEPHTTTTKNDVIYIMPQDDEV